MMDVSGQLHAHGALYLETAHPVLSEEQVVLPV